MHPWLNWIELWISTPAVTGSNPVGCTALKASVLFGDIFISNTCLFNKKGL